MYCNFCNSKHENTESNYRFITREKNGLYTYNSICPRCEDKIFTFLGALNSTPGKVASNTGYQEITK